MNRTCKHIQEILSEYCRNELEPSEFEKVHLHLQTCETCRQEYKDVLSLEKMVSSLQKTNWTAWEEDLNGDLKPHLTFEDMLAFTENRLSFGERERVRLHLEKCPDCANEAMSIHRTRLSVADTITRLNNARKKLPLEKIAAEQQLSLLIWQKIVKLRLVWAAISAVILGGLLFGYMQFRQNKPHPTLQLALADLRIGNYKSAQQLFDTLPTDVLKDSTVQFHQGMAHHIEYIASLTAPELTQYPERALDIYAILHIPPNTRTIENIQTEPLQRAVQHYRNCVKADEHNIDAWVALMLAYLRIGNLSEAQATMIQIESIPKIQKESAVYLNAQGILQLRGANPNQAIPLFEKAIQVAEDQEQPFLDPYYNLAFSYSLLDNPQGQQKAKEAWENYLLRDKNNDYWALQASEQYERVCAKLQTEPRDDLAEFVEIPNNIQGIYFGKKADEITNIPDNPTDQSNIGNRAFWTYKRDHLMLEFQNNRLSRIVLLPGNDMSVYNIRLGSSTKEVESAIGLPARIEASTKGKTFWYYTHRGLTLEMLDRRVNRIEMTQIQIGG